MAYTVESRAGNPANQLRDALDQAERLIVSVDRHTVEELLTLLDTIQQMWIDLADEGADLRAEEVRWQSLLNRLSSKPEPVVSAAAGAGGYASLRAKHPPASAPWWHLDAHLGERRRKSATRLVTTLLAIVIGVVALYYAINAVFPPDPAAVMMVDASSQISLLIREERWEDALAVVDQTLGHLPGEPELLIWRAVLLERLGKTDEAAAALQTAQDDFPSGPALFWTNLGNTRFQVNDLDGAEAAGQQAVALDPEEPQAYLLLGGLAETRGDMSRAIEMFDMTYNLAEESNPELAVIAKVRLGQALQRPMLPTPPDETTAATPTP